MPDFWFFLLKVCDSTEKPRIFHDTDDEKSSQSEPATSGHGQTKSTNSGASPSVLQHVSHCGSTRGAVKERLHTVASIRVHHLRRQARMVGHLMYLGTSRDLAKASCLMNSTDSSLQRPPVSMATTTSMHLPVPISSGYVLSEQHDSVLFGSVRVGAHL